jgi:hypothetical protein
MPKSALQTIRSLNLSSLALCLLAFASLRWLELARLTLAEVGLKERISLEQYGLIGLLGLSYSMSTLAASAASAC